MSEVRVPIATYRLQFNPQFHFTDAQTLVPYLDQLGISDIYASPITKSRKGSNHGYDVVDPTRINPELGTGAEFESMVQQIKNNNMGFLLDMVPNHMAVSSDNPFWMDLMENGLSSHYASIFDIDWSPCNGAIKNKVLLPILGKPYGRSLEDCKMSLELEDSNLFIRYNDTRLPISLKSYIPVFSYNLDKLDSKLGSSNADLLQLKEILTDIENSQLNRKQIKDNLRILLNRSPDIRDFLIGNIVQLNGEKGNPRSFDRLDDLLNQQIYHLAFWRTSREELNFRRFFDINTLIGVRLELPEVLDVTHTLVFNLVREGKVTGLRIDHIDGLYDPLDYLNNLRYRLGPVFVVAEKILTGDEQLPDKWPIQGTTGYDFSREVNKVFVDKEGMEKLEIHYSKMIGHTSNFADVVYEKKKGVIEDLFYGEANSLGCQLSHLASQDRYARDLTTRELTEALIEVTACLPVYRTYTHLFEVSPVDRSYLEFAMQEAERRSPTLEESALEFLKRFFLLEFPKQFDLEQKQNWLHLLMRWQQFTSPVAAKGLEDTALYNHNRLVSLNVIGAPILAEDEWSIDDFHRFNIMRQTHWPCTLNATSTHDTKRSEDVSARINVLSEMTRPWTMHLAWWRQNNFSRRQSIGGQPVPEPNIEELLYQTLLGAWPLTDDNVELGEFKERFKGYMLKAVREAKSFTSWVRPNEEYEKAVLYFVDGILEESDSNEFLKDFLTFQKEIAFYGALNGLSQVLLKITSPGVPDFYQGTELWNFSLVDPDNRRPVDFRLRSQLLTILIEREQQDQMALIQDILKHWQDGRVKLYLTYKTLHLRHLYPTLFQKGEYLPLYAEGKRKEYLLGFARHWENTWTITAIPRLLTHLVELWSYPLGSEIWDKDTLVLPRNAPTRWINILTGEPVISTDSDGNQLPLSQIFNTFPVALLINEI